VSNLGQHDGDGIRYAMNLSAPKGGSAQMLRDPAGGWVSWDDYARLKAEVERLTSVSEAWKKRRLDKVEAECINWADVENENARLKAQVERLTKAGDAMAAVITQFRCSPWGQKVPNAFTVWDAWNAAKEGKQS
jgi:hypothetical protein